MSEKGKLVLSWTTFLTIMTTILAGSWFLYQRLADARTYTDGEISSLRSEIGERLNRLDDKTDRILEFVRHD